jgi:hypothetical protein
LTLCLEVPGQQFVKAADGMSSREAVEDGGDVGLRVEAVQLRGFGDGVDDGGTLAACVGAEGEAKRSCGPGGST